MNAKFSFQEQYILNEGANVLAPWKQKYYLAVGWLFFSMECCFCAASVHFMSLSSELLLLFHFLFFKLVRRRIQQINYFQCKK